MKHKKMPFILHIIKSIKSKLFIKKLIQTDKEICIEIGAGEKKGDNGWLTIDISRKGDYDIYWDLRKGLPFPDGTVSKIYSSHFLEHLSYDEGQIFLDECVRALSPGGTFSVCVPNARLYIDAYINSKTLDPNQFFAWKPAYNNTTRIDYVNFTAYLKGFHKYMFDEENLLFLLKAKGLKNVHLREFDPDLDTEVRDFESIYAEGEK